MGDTLCPSSTDIVVELQENASGMYLASIFVNVESMTSFRIARAAAPTTLVTVVVIPICMYL